MKVTAIMNLKGGTGKTVTTINTAAALGKCYGRRVLVVDADSQANATEFLTNEHDEHGSPVTVGGLPDMLRGVRKVRFRETTIGGYGVQLLPADETLMDLDLSKAGTGEAAVSCLRELLRREEIRKRFDNVLIDCPPAFNAAAAAALLAADEVVIPMKLDAFGIRGMANLKRQIDNMRELNPQLALRGILPTMYYRSEAADEALEALKGSGIHVFTPIRRSVKVDDSTFLAEPLMISSPHSRACFDYKWFARELRECWGEG